MAGEFASQVVGRNVRRIREEAHDRLSQAALARRIGVTPSVMNRLEKGQRPVTVEELLSLAAALGVAPIWLLCPWQGDDPHLRVGLSGPDILLRPSWAQLWLLGEWPAIPTDAPTYFYTVPPDQRRHASDHLKWLEDEGMLTVEDGRTVFHIGDVSVEAPPKPGETWFHAGHEEGRRRGPGATEEE